MSDVAESVTLACLENGLLINQLKPNLIRFSPPLTVSEDEMDQAVRILGGLSRLSDCLASGFQSPLLRWLLPE